MLIKIVAMFRNLLISSFDATIRSTVYGLPAPASRGFASHVFLVLVRTQIEKTKTKQKKKSQLKEFNTGVVINIFFNFSSLHLF